MDARGILDSDELKAARKHRDELARNLAETAPLLSNFERRLLAVMIVAEFIATASVAVMRWRESRRS
ncbi:hypothetical protein AB0M22_09050 [Nocardia sp. NPDC051756]|uniref:hypothetical protein n=1 Tax=Nocardia sp. NPDC051756 TaxID=3154751 RepID=UPI00342BC8A2